ncbi:putative oxidoreductase [subsurface metagenome]|jgi:3-oxoacyl-[acyl-carrier protein] reductase
MQLSNKVAIVTGAGRGIGRATALALARRGADLVLADMRTQEMEAVSNEVRRIGREVITAAMNVTQKSDVESMVKKALDHFGKVDILANIAGVAVHNLIPDIREQDWDLNITVNLKGIFLCTQAVFSHMCNQGSGHIVNVSSMSGKHGSAKYGAYCASKFGVVGFTEVTRDEGRPHGVKVSVVCPGPVDTELRHSNHPDDDRTKLIKPEDVADVILFLVTRPSRVNIPEAMILAPLVQQGR